MRAKEDCKNPRSIEHFELYHLREKKQRMMDKDFHIYQFSNTPTRVALTVSVTDFISIALSFCSNWGSFDHHPNPEIMSSFQQMHDPEMAAEILMTFDGNSTLAHYDLLLDPSEFCYADNYSNFLPYFSTPSDYLTFSPEIIPQDDLQFSYQYSYHNYLDFAPGVFDGYLPNPGLVPESLPEFLTPLLVSSYSCNQHTPESYMKNPASRASLSAQSIAARERRRR